MKLIVVYWDRDIIESHVSCDLEYHCSCHM